MKIAELRKIRGEYAANVRTAEVEAQKVSSASLERHLSLSDALEQRRGGNVEKAASGPYSAVNRDGLLWLVKKARLSGPQLSVAHRYRDLYRRCEAGAIKSNLNDDAGRGGEKLPYSQRRMMAVDDLAHVHRDCLRTADLIRLVDRVIGQGETLRDIAEGDERRAGRLEAALLTGLDLMAHYWRMG